MGEEWNGRREGRENGRGEAKEGKEEGGIIGRMEGRERRGRMYI